MDALTLIEPSAEYAAEVWAFRQEILDRDAGDRDQFAGCMSMETCASAEEWLRLCALRKDAATCPQTGTAVPSDTYLAVRRADGRLVGVIDLRHHIDHPVLGVWGGHCGYTVRPSERGRGYAREMLRLNLENARRRGIKRLLVTCSTENPASEKTIRANGGVFEREIEVDGTRVKRFWITL